MSPWKSPLLLLGILAILAAGAALLAPLFIDWNAYRPTIESYGRKLTGREVRIGGAIDAQLFPWPNLTLRDVRIANPADAIHPDLFVAPVLTIELALPPLLSGHLEMTEVRIAQPTIALERLDASRGTWDLKPDRALLDEIGPRRLSFPAIRVDGGTAYLADGARGGIAEVAIGSISASAPELRGPWKVGGTVAYQGRELQLTYTSGAMRPGEPRPTFLRVAPVTGDGYSYTFEGTAPGTPDGPMNGTVSIVPVEAPQGGKADASVGVRPFSLKADVQAGFNRIALSKIELSPETSEDAGNLITGTANIQLGSRIVVDADLESPRIELDRLVDAESRRALLSKEGLDAVTALIETLPDQVVLNLRLGIASLMAGGETLEGAELSATLSAKSLKVDALKLSIPGHTKLSFTGSLLPQPAGSALSGDLRLESASLRELVTWLLPEQAKSIEAVWSGLRGQLDLSGRLDATVDRIRFSEAEIALDGAKADGNLSLSFADSPSILLRLAADRIDPGRYVNTTATPIVRDWIKALPGRLKSSDVQLTLQADELVVNNITAKDIAVDVAANDGAVELRTVEIGEVDGARVTLSGLVKLPEDGLEGSLVGDVTAADPRGLMRLIGLLPPPGSNRPDPPWAQANRLTVTLRGDARERDGITIGGIRLEGSYGGTATSLSLKYSGGLNGWRTGIFDADLSGTSPDSRSLAALFGFTPVAGGDEAGRFKLTGKGSLDAGIATTAELALFGSELRYAGTVGLHDKLTATGRAAILAEHIDGLYRALGLPLLDQGPAGRLLSAEGEVNATPERIEVSAVNGAAAGASFTGSGALGLAGDRLTLKAAGRTGRLGLAPVLALILLPRDGEPPSSTKPFGPALADVVDLDLALESDTLTAIPGLALKAASFSTKGTRDGLDLKLEGEALPGHRSSLAAAIARDGKGYRVNGSVDLDAELATLLLAQDRRPALHGEAKLAGKFTATGLSIGGLFAAMNGDGTLSLPAGVLRGVDPVAFAGGLETARTPAEIDQLVDGVLRAGDLRFAAGSTSIAMNGGVVSSEPLKITGEEVEGSLKLMFDTVAGEGDVSAVLALPELPGAPSFEIAWGGPIAALEASYDVSSLKSNISVGALSKGIDKLEELQREQDRILAEEQAFARDQAIKFTERSLRRQARDAAAAEARRQARLIAEAAARRQVEEQRRAADDEQRQEEAARQAKIRAEAEAVRKLEEEKRKLEERLRKAEERLQRDDAPGKTRPPASVPSFGQSGDASSIEAQPLPPITSTLDQPQPIVPPADEAETQKPKEKTIQRGPKSQDQASPWPERQNVRETGR